MFTVRLVSYKSFDGKYIEELRGPNVVFLTNGESDKNVD